MAVDRSVIGRSTGRARLVVERGPIAAFAKAVKDADPIYQSPVAARVAGFADVPLPPTFGFSAMSYWGAQPDLQTDVDAGTGNLLADVFGPLFAAGGIVLHGEEEFLFHAPVVAGDVLLREGRVLDLYEKESKGRLMTFMVTEDRYTNERTGALVLTTRMNLVHRP